MHYAQVNIQFQLKLMYITDKNLYAVTMWHINLNLNFLFVKTNKWNTFILVYHLNLKEYKEVRLKTVLKYFLYKSFLFYVQRIA